MCRQQQGVRTERAVRCGCGPTRGEKESAERAAASICWDGTEVPRGVRFLQASVPCDRSRGGTSSGRGEMEMFHKAEIVFYSTLNAPVRLSLLPRRLGRCRSRLLRPCPRGSCLLVSARPQRVSRPDPRRHREWPTRLPGEPARKRKQLQLAFPALPLLRTARKRKQLQLAFPALPLLRMYPSRRIYPSRR